MFWNICDSNYTGTTRTTMNRKFQLSSNDELNLRYKRGTVKVDDIFCPALGILVNIVR